MSVCQNNIRKSPSLGLITLTLGASLTTLSASPFALAAKSGRALAPAPTSSSSSSGSVLNNSNYETVVLTPKRFSLRANLQTASNFKPFESADHSGQTTLTLTPSYKTSENTKLSVKSALTKDLENEQELNLENTRITFPRPDLKLSPTFKVTPAIAAIAPTNKQSRDGESLVFGTVASGALSADLSRLKLSKLEPGYKLSVTRNFHQYMVSYDGNSNTAFSMAHELSLDYSLSDKFKLSGLVSRSTGWTYDASPKNNFEFDQSVSYNPSARFEVALGHNNSGLAYRENGRDSNMAFFDDSSSTFYLSLTFTQ